MHEEVSPLPGRVSAIMGPGNEILIRRINMEKIRVGLIGAGFVAHIHMNAYQQVKGIPVEIAGVVAKPREEAEKFARKFNIPKYYDDYRYLLDDNTIDLIDICAPKVIHKNICLDAAMSKKHIIWDKPLTGYFVE
ncbi:MAG: Gfo/Idh/MocA family oxidoreductase, partial [Firmicutes bacterium]|nr:Gfo/Idh/MocA family oxidoreductase [Bacillota bacterium]